MSEADKLRSSFSFTTRHLFIAMLLIAIPLALFQIYWSHANATVDERTIPLADLATSTQAYLYAAVIVLAVEVAWITVWLFLRRMHKMAMLLVGLVALCCFIMPPLVLSKVIHPVRGNPIASTHNDAACVVAMATIKFVDRHGRWPQRWADLDNDLRDVLEELSVAHEKRKAVTDPFAQGDPPDPYWGEEASQSISARAPDLSELSATTIPELVDMDFGADPKVLAYQKWFEFKGIVPRKPSYNFYRVEFQKLIERLAVKSDAQQSDDPSSQ